jgi:hypothetical protein
MNYEHIPDEWDGQSEEKRCAWYRQRVHEIIDNYESVFADSAKRTFDMVFHHETQIFRDTPLTEAFWRALKIHVEMMLREHRAREFYRQLMEQIDYWGGQSLVKMARSIRKFEEKT